MSDSEDELSTQPNDAFVKDAFSDPAMASAFFKEHLPPPLVTLINWSSLQLMPGSFVKQTLQQAHSDLLFSVQAEGHECFLYLLFEHQTTVDRKMPLRLLNYMLEIMLSHAEEHGLPLAPVIPMVLHQGPDRWTPAPEFEAMFGLPPSLADAMLPYLPKFRHALLDLSQFDPRNVGVNYELQALLAILKMSRRHQVQEYFLWLDDQAFDLPIEQLRKILLFAFNTERILDVEEIARSLHHNRKLKEEIMTTADKLKAEGKAEGAARARLTIFQELLGLPVSSEEEMSALTVAELDRQYNELQRQYDAQFKKR